MPPNAIELLRKGIADPSKILNYPLNKLGLNKKWHWEENFIKFQMGGFAASTRDRPEFAARCYYEISELQDILSSIDIKTDRSAEVGCGYGRLSPWVFEYSDEHIGIDPDKEALDKARELYPQISWVNATAQDMSFPDNHFDLIVTWTALLHIPPRSIEEVAEKIEATLSEDGYLIICEETKSDGAEHVWPRSLNRYKELFQDTRLIEVRERDLEPTYPSHADGGEILVFQHS